MNKLIIKYVLVLVIAFFLAEISQRILYWAFIFSNYNVYLGNFTFSWGELTINLLIRMIIVWIIGSDMQQINSKINYWILLLVLFNEYSGAAFFLITAFFQNYKSINIYSDAE